jgi:hypothetical protein
MLFTPPPPSTHTAPRCSPALISHLQTSQPPPTQTHRRPPPPPTPFWSHLVAAPSSSPVATSMMRQSRRLARRPSSAKYVSSRTMSPLRGSSRAAAADAAGELVSLGCDSSRVVVVVVGEWRVGRGAVLPSAAVAPPLADPTPAAAVYMRSCREPKVWLHLRPLPGTGRGKEGAACCCSHPG